LAGVSKQLASRKLRQGKTPKQIIQEASLRRERQRLRQHTVNGCGTAGGTGGHGGNGTAPLLSYSEAQKSKENWLSRLRQQEYEQKSGQLVPVAEVRAWQGHIWIPLLQSLRHLPSELRDMFDLLSGPQIEGLLGERIDGILAAAASYLDECFRHAGRPLTDGALHVGEYRVRWTIEPLGPAVGCSAAAVPATLGTPPPPTGGDLPKSPFRRRRRSQPDDDADGAPGGAR
jgi:hypothetical protein